MKLIGQIILCFFLLSSCSEPGKKKRMKEGILEKAKLTNLLYDTYLYEGALKSHALDSVHSDIKVVSFYDAILKKHQINRLDAQNSVEYYAKEEELIPILENVKARIKERKSSLENKTK